MFVLKDESDASPGVHAIVIGVGHYPKADACNLKDISTASVSAMNFGHWLLEKLRYPDRKLKSVDLIVSKAKDLKPSVGDFWLQEIRAAQQQDLPAWDFEKVTYDGVTSAVIGWLDRLDRPDEVGIFYFCGHGIEHGAVIALLLEEFDGTRRDFSESFDLRQFYAATARAQGRNKYFFIDACRSTPPRVKDLARISPRPLVEAEDGVEHQGDAPLYIATKSKDDAIGIENETAQFTKAVLAALNGAGAERGEHPKQDHWVVKSTSLMEGIRAVLELFVKIGLGKEQKPETQGSFGISSSVLHVPGKTIRIPTDLVWPSSLTASLALVHPPGTMLVNAGRSPVNVLDLAIPGPLPVPLARVTAFRGAESIRLDPEIILIDPPILRWTFETETDQNKNEVVVDL